MLWPRPDTDGNCHGKRRTFAEGALDLDVAAQHTRETARNRQAEAGTALRPGNGPLGLLEWLENSRVIFVRDPDAAILDAQVDEPRAAAECRTMISIVPSLVYLSALLSRLTRICFTFCRSLLNRGTSRRHVDADGDGALRDDSLRAPRELRHHVLDRELRDLQRHSSGLDALDVEDVVDQGREMLAVGVDSLNGSRLLLGQRPVEAADQHQRIAENGVERRAELVGYIREELRLRLRGLFEREGLAPQQLVLMRELRGGFADLGLELRAGPLQLDVQPLALDCFRLVVENGHDAGQLTGTR